MLFLILKRLHIVVFSLLLSVTAISQEKYHIIQVKGDMRVKGSEKLLMTRDVVYSNQEIVFGSSDAMAAAISSSRGRYIIKAHASDESDSEIVAMLKDVLLESSGKLSTRGSLNTFFELQNYFTGVHVMLGDTARVRINSISMEMNSGNFFFLRYEYGDEIINKKLSFSGENLHFVADEIYSVDGKPIDQSQVTSFALYYYRSVEQISKAISEFELIFPDNQVLMKEVQVIVDLSQGIDVDKMRSEVESYISETYGKPYRPNFLAWMDETFLVE